MAIPLTCAGCGTDYRLRDSYAGRRVKCRICGQRIRVPEPLSDEGQIIRHQLLEREFQPAVGDEQAIEAITRHFERHVGKVESVFHELVSDLVHIDVHFIPAAGKRRYHTLFTTGMSDLPMMVPEEAESLAFAELLICLPSGWPLTEEAFQQEENYWPVRWLKMLARFPHEYQTWLGYGHTIPNGDPPRPFAENTRLCCAMLLPPTIGSENLHVLKMSKAKTVHVFAIYFLYPDEVSFKLKQGAKPLESLFHEHGVTEVVDVKRPSVIAKRRRGGAGR